jgi:hypothetical protein
MAVATAPADPITRFRSDHQAYCRVALRIFTKEDGLQPLRLNSAQRLLEQRLDAQLEATGAVRAIVLKARQEGISTGVAARFIRKSTLWSHRNVRALADVDDRAEEIAGIYERFFENLPAELQPERKTTRKGKLLWFEKPRYSRNPYPGLDSRIAVKTAGDRQAGRSAVTHYVHASEFAYWPDPATTLLSLMQSVPRRGTEVVIESTANGVGNAFHQMWEAAEAGDSGWIPIFLPWFIHEEYRIAVSATEREEVEATLDADERRMLTEGIAYEGDQVRLDLEQIAWRRWCWKTNCASDWRQFAQEYPSTAEEAFLVSGNCFFDEPRLAEFRKLTRPPLRRANLVDRSGAVFVIPSERGWLKLWEQPDPDGHYVIGADTAEGKMSAQRTLGLADPEGERGGRDFCSADVVRAGYFTEVDGKRVRVGPRQVAQLHGRMAPEVFAAQLNMLGHLYACRHRLEERDTAIPSLMAVERNHSSGQTVLSKLRETLRYPNLYWRRRVNRRAEPTSKEVGWVTDGETRPLMLDHLAELVRTDGLEIPSADTLKEMRTFVMAEDGRPEAEENCHDDRVISLSIAVQMLSEHVEPVADSRPLPPVVRDTPTGW